MMDGNGDGGEMSGEMGKIERGAALDDAARRGDEAALRTLVEGASAEAGGRALWLAAANGHSECVKLLIPLAGALARKVDALEWAAQGGHAECVRLLIPASDPLAKGSYPLRLAAVRGHEECVRLLISVSDPLAENSAALRVAAAHGRSGCVAALLPASDPEARSDEGMRAVDEARQGGFSEVAAMIEAFVEAKALSQEAKQAGRRASVSL